MANTKITTNVIADDAITTAKIADDAVGNDQLASGLTLGGNTAATLSTAAQPNITSVGTLSALTVSGNLNATLTTAAQPNITSVGTLTGLNVSGGLTGTTATFTTADNSAVLTVRSTDSDGSTGPLIVFDRESGSPAAGDLIGRLLFQGENDAAEDTTYARIHAGIVDASDGTEDGLLQLASMLDGTVVSRMEMNATETVFNEGSKDLNFRVESDNNGSMFVVNASSDRVHIGSSGATSVGQNMMFTIQGTNSAAGMSISRNQNDASGPAIQFAKSRGTAVNATTAVQSGDTLGNISFRGADGTDTNTSAGRIRVQVDGTPGSNDMPGRMLFETTPDGSVSPITRLTIDSNGVLLVGTTDTAPGAGDTNVGVSIRGVSDNRSFFSVNGDYVINANRNSSDGPVIQIARDGTTVGSIGTNGGRLSIGSGDVNLNFNASANSIYPISDTAGNLSDGSVDIGASSARFKDLWLSGGVYLGGTAGGNRLEEYEHGAHAVTAVGSTSGSLSFTSNNSLAYARIGRVVHVQGQLAVAGTSGTLSGGVRFSLPFSVANLGDIMERGVGTCAIQGVNHGGFSTLTSTQDHGVSFFTILITSNNGNFSHLGIDQISSGDDFRFGFTYITTD